MVGPSTQHKRERAPGLADQLRHGGVICVSASFTKTGAEISMVGYMAIAGGIAHSGSARSGVTVLVHLLSSLFVQIETPGRSTPARSFLKQDGKRRKHGEVNARAIGGWLWCVSEVH